MFKHMQNRIILAFVFSAKVLFPKAIISRHGLLLSWADIRVDIGSVNPSRQASMLHSRPPKPPTPHTIRSFSHYPLFGRDKKYCLWWTNVRQLLNINVTNGCSKRMSFSRVGEWVFGIRERLDFWRNVLLWRRSICGKSYCLVSLAKWLYFVKE